MSIEIKTPMLPESITDATVAVCHKQQGQFCQDLRTLFHKVDACRSDEVSLHQNNSLPP